MQSKPQKRTQGFTLIELVVATLIIGLLAAVLVPNALGARARANGSAVQTFLKNISQEMETTYADAGAYYPAGAETDGVFEGDEVAFGALTFATKFLSSSVDETSLKAEADWKFPINKPKEVTMVFRTNVPDAHSGYCIVARWNSQDTANYYTYMLTPDAGIQTLEGDVTDAVQKCPVFDGQGQTVADQPDP